MGLSHEGSRISQRTRDSLPIFNLYPSVVTKDSKAQHLLGLSRAQLHDARNESLILQVEPRPISFSSPKKLSPHNLFSRRKSRAKTTAVVEEDAHRPRTTEQRTSSDRDSDLASQSQTTSLKRFPSSSTLRSFYDVATAPLRVSQQTSNSSIHDFALQQIEPEIQSLPDDEMESTKPPRFSQVPKLHSITEDKKLDRDDYQTRRIIRSSISRGPSIDEIVTKIPVAPKVSTLSPPPTPSSPPTYQSRESYFKNTNQNGTKPQLERATSDNTTNSSWNSPYKKVHVRRPKAGTKHWFDDVGGVSSDDDSAIEPETRQPGSTEGKKPFRKGHIAYQSLDMDHKEIQAALSSERKNTDSVFELSAADVVPPSELEGSPIAHRQHVRKKSNISQKRSNPLVGANLNHVSILHLSDSEDESEKEDIEKPTIPRKPVPSANSAVALHRTVSIERCDDSNTKTRSAQAARPVNKSPRRSPSPIQVADSSTPDGMSSKARPVQAAPASDYADSESIPDNESDHGDSEVDALISSFPATPTDARRPRRTSSHSSVSSSDETSVASLRVMRVTRQEENLIAAMREKRAAMKRAEKITVRAATLKKSDADEKTALAITSPDPNDRVNSTVSSIIRLYTDEAEPIARKPVPATSATSQEPANIRDVSPLRRSRGNELQESPVIVSNQDRPEKSQLLRVIKQKSAPARPDSLLSTTSGVSQQSTDNMIVLDNLGAAAASSSSLSHTFPSQLFIESPFEVWKRIDSASLD